MRDALRLTTSVPALLAALALAGCVDEAPRTKMAEVPRVEVSLPVTETVSDLEDFTGSLRAVYDVTVNARVTGYLVKADETALPSIVSLDPLYVYFDVNERTLLRLRRLVREGKVRSRAESVIPIQVGLADEVAEDGTFLFPHQGEIDFSDNKVDP